MNHVVDIAATVASYQEQIQEIYGRIARQTIQTPRAERQAVEAELRLVCASYKQFRDRWVRGGAGVRGGTV